MYENQGTAAVGVGQGGYAGTQYTAKAVQPDMPLLEYATQELQRLCGDLEAQVRGVNSFVDSVRGPIPTLLGNQVDSVSKPLPPPNRGEALREAIRQLQSIRNAGDEAVKRLAGI